MDELETRVGKSATLVPIDVFVWQIGDDTLSVGFVRDQVTEKCGNCSDFEL